MAKFVPDIKTQRWIIIAPVRNYRPDEMVAKDKTKNNLCVFCPGNEFLTTPEILRLGEGEKNKPGWKVRVVPNKFPITDIHEVIIHGPSHERDIDQFEVSEVADLLKVYKMRFAFHQNNGQVMIFSNHGEHAGASQNHPHSQLVVIPRQINLDALVREPVMNIVDDSAHFVTYCHDFSQWPYEVWIASRKEETIFSDITDEELADLAHVLRNGLKRLTIKYSDTHTQKLYPQLSFSYNYYIHHAKSWFIRIIPRLVHRAGFELGTGLSVNIVDPTLAATELKEIKV